ncbi:MAG: magnesium transporter CorA family protein [Bacillota bacterium]|nr:magnesium transporter CorA family protein [Bacillota bacterium]
MLTIYKTTLNGELVTTDVLTEKGNWINLVAPSEAELQRVSQELGISLDFLRAPLDEEEIPRIEAEECQVLVLISIPVVREDRGSTIYDTIPLGIIVTEDNLVTVCLRENAVLEEFITTRPKSFYTFKKTRFLLQILFKTATLYLKYLRQIDRQTGEIEERLQRSMKNEELVRLLNLGKSLVYFTTSLKANEIVMEKLLRTQLAKVDPDSQAAARVVKMYPEDEDLLEDVITENKQAIEMGDIYTNILNGMMDAFASIISNNLNMVMKFLTSVTIVLSLPTMVASFYGMNVSLPFQDSPLAFPGIMGLSLAVSLVGVYLLARQKMF